MRVPRNIGPSATLGHTMRHMMIGREPNYGTNLLLLFTASVLALSACSGEELVQPTEGILLVATSTTGADPDPDGYSVAVDELPEQTVGIRDTLTVPNLEPGDHNVTLTGVTQNCTLAGAGRRIVNVVPGDTVTVTFRVTCESLTPPPPPGGEPQP
jgi:hypothetical protein